MKKNLFVMMVLMVVASFSVKSSAQEAVDLGLSVKWATCNLGASSPSDYGKYYAWGETRDKREYTPQSYMHRDSKGRYSDLGLSIKGTRYDAATANWGRGWRMPTKAEWEELLKRCKWEKGDGGWKIIGPNGKSIFLPLCGYAEGFKIYQQGSRGRYWTADTYTRGTMPYAYLASIHPMISSYTASTYREIGCGIRPVKD